MSAGSDVLNPEAGFLPGIGSLYTDGDWLWREDLSYYVTKYHVSLPGEFLVRLRGLNYKPPSVPESRLKEILIQVLGVSMN